MLVKDILKIKGSQIYSIGPEALLPQAVNLMVEHDIGSLLVMEKGRARRKKVHFAFKDVQGEFLKRPEGDVQFDCEAGELIDAMIDESLASGQRINRPIQVVATCPSLNGDEAMARFVLTLSIKAS